MLAPALATTHWSHYTAGRRVRAYACGASPSSYDDLGAWGGPYDWDYRCVWIQLLTLEI